MTDLREQLVRLAERGPLVDPQVAVRHAMQRVSSDKGADQIEANTADCELESDHVASVSRRLHLIDRPVVEQARRSRKVGVAAAAAVVLVSVAGATMAWSAFTSPSAIKLPSAATTAPSTTVEPSTSTSVAPDLDNDPTLLAMMNSLLDVGTTDEMVLAFSTNVPESDVAACMHAAGYSYIAGETPAEQVADDLRKTIPAADFAGTYGFGVAASELGLLPQILDPNVNYLSSLTSSQQDAYFAAQSWCAGRTPERTRVSTALNAALDQIRQGLAADPQVVAALGDWRACMADARYSYQSPQAMLESLYARMSNGLDHEHLRQLLIDEIPIALANVPCQAAYDATYREAADARFDEFRALFDTALAGQGSASDS